MSETQDTWVRKIPWRRKWRPTPVFLPGEFHRQGSPAGYSPRSRKDSDTTEQLSSGSLYVEQVCKTSLDLSEVKLRITYDGKDVQTVDYQLEK